MAIRVPWDKYEAVILLEGLLSSLNGEVTRTDAVKRVSRDLRKMALGRGIEIDDVFRNENGILFQMQSMESAYQGYTIFKPATKLFTEVSNTYHESIHEYQKLLEEAKAMINETNSVENDFKQYLASKVSPAQLSELYRCYSEIEVFCLKVKVLKNPLFHTTDFEVIKKVQRTIEQNKIFRVTHRKQYNKLIAAGRYYYTYIKEGRYPQNLTMSNSTTADSNKTLDTAECLVAVDVPSKDFVKIPLVRNEQDERLLKKYPSVYDKVFAALEESSVENTKGISIGEISERIHHVARPAVVEEILDNASWALSVDENYIFSANIVDHSVAINESDEMNTELPVNDENIQKIDFNGSFDLAYSKPESFSYFGDKITCENSWTQLYVTFMAIIIEDYPYTFRAGMSFSKSNGRIELANNTEYNFMIAPKPVHGTDYMLETNISASDIGTKIKYVLDLCNVDYENVVITYKKKSDLAHSADEKSEREHSLTVMENKINSATFFHYMSDTLKLAEATCRSYASAINNGEAFAKEHYLSSWKLYTSDTDVAQETIRLLLSNADFLNYNERQHNRFRAALKKLLIFIGGDFPQVTPTEQEKEPVLPYKNGAYEDVLNQHFKKGFRMESPLEIRKFRRYYSAIHDAELTDSDEDISRNITSLCIVYDGKAFLPDVMLSEELKEELLDYIADAFANGKTAIYYQAIFAEFADAFLDYHIHDAEMLKSYLTFISNGRFYLNRSFVSKEPNVTLNPLSEIRSCLQEYGRPVEYDELFDALPHLPQSKIKFILACNGEFINNGHGAYFHESIVRLSDEELEEIAEIIRQTIAEKDFIGGNELYDAIKAKYPYVIEENHGISVYGFRDALKAKLGNLFSFKGNIISQLGQEISMADVFAKYAKSHDSFTLSELQGLANNLATIIYFEPVYENSLRISKDQFVSKELAQFPVHDIDEAIGRVCTGNYISIHKVTNFGIFPYAGFTWNSFLLEHYVANYSQKYLLLHSSFNGTECAGAIVKRSAGINSFDDLIVDLLVNNSIEMKKASVLQFLSDKGYLARRRYSEIESLIIKAKAQKQWKDNN